MVSIDKFEQHSTEVYQGSLVSKCLYQFAGLSTDTKPTSGVATGSCFMEVNTGDVYLYDEAGNTWNKVGG